MVAQNCLADDEADEFVDDVRMWVYEEDYQVSGSGAWVMFNHVSELVPEWAGVC
jgi:hypothetical protein